MQAANGNLTIAAGASIASNSGVTLGTGANFVNLAGSGALSAGSGARWLVYSTNPTTDTTGGLTPDFIQYAAGFEATPAQTSGDGLLYSVAPAITVTALGGSVSKTYDGGTAATLTAAGSNYTVSGLLNGDAVVSMSGSYQSPDAGSNISVTSAASAAGLTVANRAVSRCTATRSADRLSPPPSAASRPRLERGDRRRSDQGLRRHHDGDADLGELQPVGLRRRPGRDGQSTELGRLCIGSRRSPSRERHVFQHQFRSRLRHQSLELRPAHLRDGRRNDHCRRRWSSPACWPPARSTTRRPWTPQYRERRYLRGHRHRCGFPVHRRCDRELRHRQCGQRHRRDHERLQLDRQQAPDYRLVQPTGLAANITPRR